MEDEELVKMYLRREEKAIGCSKDKYGERLQKIAHNITSDRMTAEEVENDTYFRAWENIPPKEPYTYLFAFLARISRKPIEAQRVHCGTVRGNGTVYSRGRKR